MPPAMAAFCSTSPDEQVKLEPLVPPTAKPVLAFTLPDTCKVAPLDEGARPIPTLLLVVSATNRFEVPALFWIWKAVTESVAFWNFCPLPVKVWLLRSSRATLEDNRASFNVPLLTLLALSEVRLEPSPVKELLALEKVLAPVKVWVPLSLARLESFDRSAELIWMPFIWYCLPEAMDMLPEAFRLPETSTEKTEAELACRSSRLP